MGFSGIMIARDIRLAHLFILGSLVILEKYLTPTGAGHTILVDYLQYQHKEDEIRCYYDVSRWAFYPPYA